MGLDGCNSILDFSQPLEIGVKSEKMTAFETHKNLWEDKWGIVTF